ncbi:hypothetical protein AVEN_259622-1 [Araneus ventricosus]|uniref:Mariner Mos1 transposase n=1 Tax=Araneus ventricosus TaxID=182803 RepID=A0A4Y2N114_ARAVE|nr:hypothetical protein AVEN_259622-1 [Araneus ventricosus]
MGAALTFLQRYHHDGDEFLDKLVTGDETWVHYETEETKEQSKQWMHSHSPSRKPVKFKRTFFTKKCMATVFWDRKGVLLVEFMPRGTTITATSYSKTLQRLRRAIQNKRRGMLSSGIMTMRGRTLQLQQRSFCSVLDGKFLITHHTILTWLPQIFISLLT